MNSQKKLILEETKELIEHNRSIGLYSLSIIFGLVIGIGGNVIYDWFIKGNPNWGLAFLIGTCLLIVFFAITARHVEKKMSRLEEKLEKLE